MTDDVVMPCDSCAVTTTSFSMRLYCFNRSVRVAVSPFQLVYVCVSVWYPRYDTLTVYLPEPMSWNMKFPEMSLTVVCFLLCSSVIITVA